MRNSSTYRGARRNMFHNIGMGGPKDHMERLPQKHSRHRPDQKEMIRQAMIPAATMVLMSGPKAQKPSFKAVRKAVRWLLASELHVKAAAHVRGSWRSWRTYA
jgi:hypothetical protein